MSPATEKKQVTFAWAEVAEEDSRVNRANTRRTHSARDSSEDSVNAFDATREPKRRRTIESDIVEDSEARKATSSMRHKVSLHHSTPAETLVCLDIRPSGWKSMRSISSVDSGEMIVGGAVVYTI